ncbi:MAG: hemerythrin domain-containing protein [Acidobacteria bacterium]|nr:hemerythrin domain-containing protein [Acidobacteriota bacterium]
MPATTAAPADLSSKPLRDVIEHVVSTHHVYLREELPYLERMIGKMAANHGKDTPFLVTAQRIILELKEDLLAHLAKEEQVLFPYVAQLEEAGAAPEACFPSVQYPIRMMMMEHDGATDLLVNLRRVTNGYTAPDFACENGRAFFTRLAAFEADMYEHIRVENQVLFPRAVELEESGR